MHLATLNVNGRASPGVIAGTEIVDLAAAGIALAEAERLPLSVRGILEQGKQALALVSACRERVLNGPAALREQLRKARALISAADAALLAPVPDPGIVLGAGLNYHAHLKEMKNTPVPEKPASLYKSPAAVIGPGAAIVPPPEYADMVDYEGEFSAVFGRACHRVKAAEALDYIAG